jgi:hypothetical protein
MKWWLFAGFAALAYYVWNSRKTPFAGFTSTGWGGNLTGSLPGLVRNRATINDAPSYGVSLGNFGAAGGQPIGSNGIGVGAQGSAGGS